MCSSDLGRERRLLDVVGEQTAGWGADVVFECSGHPSAYADLWKIGAPGNRTVLVGIPVDPVPVDVTEVQARETTIESVFRYANVYQRAIDLVAAGRISLALRPGGHPDTGVKIGDALGPAEGFERGVKSSPPAAAPAVGRKINRNLRRPGIGRAPAEPTIAQLTSGEIEVEVQRDGNDVVLKVGGKKRSLNYLL